ncbi:hypothetical protein SAMN05216428_10165 [Nitrosospira sp. Nsp11]|uniref:DUF7940 domain-containing protein n=1 Tax=Nitrosospira sp. Nsp11 TaxID=1855338 RepID=UPI00091D49C2|nr:hypothetical protein [Nitrosospira sp. Nsp11]SHL09803.1 hypothetical protein SAMN05216428_10165 [Nitrosospira sp. Nsp11]
MTLIPNADQILDKAWSVKLAYLAAGLVALAQVIGYVPPGLVGATPELLAAIVTAMNGVAGAITAIIPRVRVIDQGLGVIDE